MVTHDPRAATDLTIRAVYTDDRVYILARFPDPDENRTHKTQVWVPDQDRYRTGTDREDTFVIKWSMAPGSVDLRVDADRPYKADIWFWKAHRTNQLGYADDKWHLLTSESRRKAIKMWSPTHGVLDFQRIGDAGSPAYEEKQFFDYRGDTIPRYAPVQPLGSRADIRAKGVWRDEKWHLEFGRKLQTGQGDDVAFDPSKVYLFAVSCYEMAYGKVDPEISQPLYKAGDAFDRLLLKFVRKDER